MNNQSYHTDRMNEYPDALVCAAEVSEADMPVTLLAPPREDGLVDNGITSGEGSNVPVNPLSNPPEGRSVGSSTGFPPIFRPVFPGGTGGIAVIPGITFPCFNCTATSFGRVRFLNASTGYQPFYVYLGNWMIASQIGSGDITSYVQSASGSQTVTVSGANGYIYIQKNIQVRSGSAITIAIINTANGLDIMEISDISCSAPSGASCLRSCNLSQNLGPFDISIGNQNSTYTAFTNVRYREVTPYTSFYPGWYQLFISRSGAFPAQTLATASVNMSANISYTLYIFNSPNSTGGLRTMVVSN